MVPDREQILERACVDALDVVFAKPEMGVVLQAEHKLNNIAILLQEALDSK